MGFQRTSPSRLRQLTLMGLAMLERFAASCQLALEVRLDARQLLFVGSADDVLVTDALDLRKQPRLPRPAPHARRQPASRGRASPSAGASAASRRANRAASARAGRGRSRLRMAICWPLVKPSDGLEPSTPLLTIQILTREARARAGRRGTRKPRKIGGSGEAA